MTSCVGCLFTKLNSLDHQHIDSILRYRMFTLHEASYRCQDYILTLLLKCPPLNPSQPLALHNTFPQTNRHRPNTPIPKISSSLPQQRQHNTTPSHKPNYIQHHQTSFLALGLLNTFEAAISTANPTGCNQKNPKISQRTRPAGIAANIGSLGTNPICTIPEKKNVAALSKK